MTVRSETLADNSQKLSRTFSSLDFHATPPTDLNPKIVKELPKEKNFRKISIGMPNAHRQNAKPVGGQTRSFL